MAKYIDAEALKQVFKNGVRVYDGMCTVHSILQNIDNMPTADVEKVVYCKDCKNHLENSIYEAICEEFGGRINNNDFCSRCPQMIKERD